MKFMELSLGSWIAENSEEFCEHHEIITNGECIISLFNGSLFSYVRIWPSDLPKMFTRKPTHLIVNGTSIKI